MEYTLRTPALSGEIAILYSVAEAMADRRANASGAGFHRPTFDGAILQYTNSLIAAAESGRLQVCNKCGDQGTPAGILEEAISKGQFVSAPSNERLTLALQVCVRLHHLNLWAQERGDIFRVELVGWADERGHVWPSESGKAKESPKTDDRGGAQAARSKNDVVVPDKAGPLAVAAKPARRESWLNASLPYSLDTYKAGQYATAKAFYKALESKAGTAESPFDKGTGQNAGSLFVRSTSSTLALNTLANQFWPIRDQPKKARIRPPQSP